MPARFIIQGFWKPLAALVNIDELLNYNRISYCTDDGNAIYVPASKETILLHHMYQKLEQSIGKSFPAASKLTFFISLCNHCRVRIQSRQHIQAYLYNTAEVTLKSGYDRFYETTFVHAASLQSRIDFIKQKLV